MEKILFISHVQDDGTLSKPALDALGAAKKVAGQLGAGFSVGLFGRDAAQAADSIAGCGAGDFFAVTGDDFAAPRYASDTAAIQALCQAAGATLVIGPAVSRISRVFPGAAQRLGGRIDAQAADLSAEGGALQITRWYYRQRMYANLTRTQRPWFVTVSPGCFEPCAEPGSAQVQDVAAELPDSAKRTSVVEVQSPAADEQTIRPEAEMLFVAGAGWTKKQADGQAHIKEAETLILDFIGATKSSLGSSKSLVDLSGEGQEVLGFMTHLHQVGQTGSTPRHKKGLAACCHGEEPHVVGWRFINERRAVNLDAACGWAQGKADVLYVADAFAVMAKVNELLNK